MSFWGQANFLTRETDLNQAIKDLPGAKIGAKMKILILLLYFLATFSFAGEIKNPDKPLKGNWDLKLKKSWEITKAGDEVLGFPFGQLVCDNGNLVIFDAKNGKNFLYDKDGKFLKSFGPCGEGPGEIREQEQLFLVNKKIVAPDRNKIHYFTADGEYSKSVVVKGIRRRPALFLNEDEFISATLIPHNAPGGIGTISRINVVTDKITTLKEFSVFKGGVAGKGSAEIHILVNALTPIMTLAHYTDPVSGKTRIYYGMSDTYKINIMDETGKPLGSFSVDRKKRDLDPKKKKERFKDMYKRRPAAMVDEMIKSLPDKLTYFNRIQVIDGLVYIFESYFDLANHRRRVDIFSPEGKYLYCAIIKVEKGLGIRFAPFHNLVLKQGSLHVVLEKEDGILFSAKYAAELPKN